MTKPLSEMERSKSSTATSPRPLELKSLLKELAGEDTTLRMPIIEAAVTGSELSFQPSDPELRTRAAKAWTTIHSIMAHHLASEDLLILPWAQARSALPPELIEKTRKEHQELLGASGSLARVSFERGSDEEVARAGKVLCVFAALLDDIVAGEQGNLFPMLRRALFATSGPHTANKD
jgi:hypothetical protein